MEGQPARGHTIQPADTVMIPWQTVRLGNTRSAT